MDIRKIKKLIEMLQDSDLKEIEVSQGDESVRISRDNRSQTSEPIIQKQVVHEASNIVTQEEIPQEEVKDNKVTSPIVGTFYRKPSPDKDPFIKVGDVVQEGDILCIIEAMKMMNEIKSEYSGTVLSVNVENAEPVEYGQSLFELSK